MSAYRTPADGIFRPEPEPEGTPLWEVTNHAPPTIIIRTRRWWAPWSFSEITAVYIDKEERGYDVRYVWNNLHTGRSLSQRMCRRCQETWHIHCAMYQGKETDGTRNKKEKRR